MNRPAADRVRVAHVIETLGAGGAEMLLADVVERLDRQRFESCVIPLDGPLTLMPRLQAAQVAVEPVWQAPRRRPVACLAGLARRLRAYRPGVIHTHLYFANVLGRLAAVSLPRAAVVTTLHNPDYTHEARPGPAFRFRKALDRFSARRNVAFIAVSHAVAEDYRRHMGWPRIEVVHNGVDLERFAPGSGSGPARDVWPGDGTRVLAVGRLHAQKGHAVLLRALAACRERGVRLSLAVAGEGPLRAELEGLARGLGVEGMVRFLGPRDDVLCLLRGCDLFAFPSLYEAFGVALLEAMACGKPVVASRAGGVSEVVEDGVSGILVPPGDADALARALAALAGDLTRGSALGRAARRRAEAFDIGRTVRRLEEVYVRVRSGSES